MTRHRASASCGSARCGGTRRGSTLVELLVAIPVGAMLCAVAVMLLIDAHRLARRVNSGTGITRELRHAAALLSADLRPLAASDLIAWTDTSLDIEGAIGAGIACGTPAPNIVDLLPATPTDAMRTAWATSPQPGDRVWVVTRDSALLAQNPAWRFGTLQNSGTTASSSCTTSPLRAAPSTARPVRLTLSSTDSIAPPSGTPVRVTRRVHYSLYKSSDNLWYLGRRTLGPSGWDVIQPAAGPLRTPAQRGLELHVYDRDDNQLHAPTTAIPASFTLAMRAASVWKQSSSRPGAEDSLTLRIALRGESTPPPEY